jgi:hypothetical protein
MSISLRPRRGPRVVETRAGSPLAVRVTVVILELFVGIGGVFGGLEMIRHPLNPLGMSTELIAGSPFDTYTWPGILLMVLVGVTPCVLAVGVITRRPGALEVSGMFGIGLMAWIGVQWVLLPDRLWLQPIIFGIGAVITALATRGRRPGRGPSGAS